MEYPKTIEAALDALQGDWQIEDSKISFSIEGMEVTNPVGVMSMGIEITNNMEFTLKPSNTAIDKWRIDCGPVFGSADIIEWDENSFKTSQFITHMSVGAKPHPHQSIFIQKYLRLHKQNDSPRRT